jgi:putative ABC transport system substrate-binding protein
MAMRRRDFIRAVIGSTAGWPLAAQAQGPDRLRRIGALMPEAESLAESQARKTALEQALSKLGWKLGRTLAIDYLWAVNNPERASVATAELLALKPELILAAATPATKAAHQATRIVPTVFVAVSEPVSQGLVASLAHPGGNITGFTNLEATFGGKWLELLKEIAPGVTRAAILFNPETSPFAVPIARAAEEVAPKLGMTSETIAVRGAPEIEAAITRVANEPGRGLIFPPDTHTATHLKLVLELSERYRLPAIHGLKLMATEGALAFYGVDIVDLFRAAAGYIDRILKGEKPADLPVQQPTKYELVINLKAAKAIGLAIAPTLLARADEVLE